MPQRYVFGGSRSAVFHNSVGGSEVVVSFDHWSKGKNTIYLPDATTSFNRSGYDQIFFRTSKNDWFFNHDLFLAVDAIVTEVEKYKKVYAISSSMGGQAALFLSRFIGFSKMIFVSPVVNGTKVSGFPENPFSTDEIDQSVFSIANSMIQMLPCAAKEADVFDDPLSGNDFEHAEFVCGKLNSVELKKVPLSGHPATCIAPNHIGLHPLFVTRDKQDEVSLDARKNRGNTIAPMKTHAPKRFSDSIGIDQDRSMKIQPPTLT